MLQFKKATQDDAEGLTDLINHSYRNRASWTHECDLLDGQRITREAVVKLIDSHLETAWLDGELVGCVHLDGGSLGLLSVRPDRQTRGVARRLLERAHELCRSWNHTEVSLTVLAQRPELIAYYQRRGYRLSGKRLPFPVDDEVGQPKRDLELLEMLYTL